MIRWFKAWLRTKVLTPAEQQTLALFDKPDRWMPENPITPEEAKMWGGTLKSGLLIKIDHAMINLAMQYAQQAVGAKTPTAEVVRVAGFADGFRAGWQTTKSLSVMFATKSEHAEQDATTGASVLDQHNP